MDVTVVLTRLQLAALAVLALAGGAFVLGWATLAGLLFVLAAFATLWLTFGLLMISALREHARRPANTDMRGGPSEIGNPDLWRFVRSVLTNMFRLTAEKPEAASRD